MTTPAQRAKARMKQIQQAMLPLIGDSRFQEFMAEVSQQQKAAMIDACNERVVGNARLSLAALGEVRAYEGLISFYEGQVDLAEQLANESAPQ